MDMLALLCIVSVAFTGLTKGTGVLPDGPLNAAVGGSVMFNTTVTPSENPIGIVAWYFGTKLITTFNNINITESEYEGRITLFISTGSLELRNLALNDSGEYKVVITPPGARPTHGNTKLDVYERVSNVKATANSTDLVEFSSVRLSCSSSGSSLSFLWMNSSSEVTASDRVQFTDGGSTLTILSVTHYDQGPYRCNVSNPVSVGTSNFIKLSISYGPENVRINGPNEIKMNHTLTLNCSAESKPSASYIWKLNGTEIHNSAVFTKHNTEFSDSGTYTCEASNIRTERTSSAVHRLFVTAPVANVVATSNSTDLVEFISSVRLSCSSSGSSLSFLWLNSSSEVTASDRVQLTDGNSTLTILNVTRYDQGPYRCNVSNPVSVGSSDPVNFNISYGPENVRIEGPNEIKMNHTLTLNCSAESKPSASYTWKLNGTEIHNSAVFTKASTELSDSGNYICEVSNIITGRTSSAAHRLFVTANTENTSPSCSTGCIVGIVIACAVVCVVAVGGGCYIYKKKKWPKTSSNRNAGTRTGGQRQNNTAYSGNQELNYADISFFQNKAGGRVQLGSQADSSEYADVRVNSGRPAASSPPTYDAHLQRSKRPAPHPGANGAQVRRT